MKRAAIHHPKLFRLMDELGCDKATAVGVIQSIWLFAAEYTPQGDIGRIPTCDIQRWIDYRGCECAHLERALVKSGFIDESEEHRLVVHDWADHADESCKKHIRRNLGGVVFTADGVVSIATGGSDPSIVRTCPDKSASRAHARPLAEAVNTYQTERARASTPVKSNVVEAIYEAYPRKRAKQAALRAIRKAIDRLAADVRTGLDREGAAAYLLKRTRLYAASPEGHSDEDLIAYPATWFNQGDYDSDESRWQKRRTNDRPRSREPARGGSAPDAEATRRLLDELENQ